MNKKYFLPLVALSLVLATLACTVGPVTVDFNPTSTPSASPAVSPTLAAPGAGSSSGCTPPAGYSGYWAVPPGCPGAPAPTPASPVLATPAAPAAGAPACLKIAQVKDILERNHKIDAGNPGPAITELDVLFDTNASVGSWIGEQWMSGPHKVNRNSNASVIVWTNTNFAVVKLGSIAADSTKWVPLFVQGSWGIYVAYDDVTIPSPGRLGWTCELFKPSSLNYWK